MSSVYDRLQLCNFLLSRETYNGAEKKNAYLLVQHRYIVGTLRRKTQELEVVESFRDIINS